ncbi:hypothetical protein [Streptomyces liliiviolaceus]|nr:hypothetical protein [Streptomyces liliiviolaceus]
MRGPGIHAPDHSLVRLPAVRSPWRREILDNMTQHPHAHLF